MAPVSLTCCESTLPLTLSLSDSGNYFYPLAPAPRAPIQIRFSDIATPAPAGRQPIAPSSLGVNGNSTRHRTSAITPLMRTLALKFWIGFIRSRAARDVGLA